MKQKMFKLAAFTLLLVGTMVACDNKIDNPESSVIEKEIEGITFQFCLLNEQGKPATVFNEGENFSFYFSVANRSKKDFFHDGSEILGNRNFLRVYNSSGVDFGKSYESLIRTDIGIAAYPFNNGDVDIINVPWVHDKSSISCGGGNIGYNSIVQKPLAKGKYYTYFMYDSHFYEKQSDNFIKDSINFKINFKIQ